MPNAFCMIVLFNLVSNHGYVHADQYTHVHEISAVIQLLPTGSPSRLM